MSSNYDSIPATTRNVIDTFIHNDNNKNAIGRLWRLYLRVNHGDTEYAEQDLQNFVNELQNLTQDSMLDAINQKIYEIQREENMTAYGLKKNKKGKTGKKRKGATMKTSRKKRKRRH